MKCTKCGSENAADAKYCASCNHEQSVDTATDSSIDVAAAPPSSAEKLAESVSNHSPTTSSTYVGNVAPATNAAYKPATSPYTTSAQASASAQQPTAYPYTQAATQAQAQPQQYRPATSQYQQGYNPYPSYPPYNTVKREKQAFSIVDAYIITGFVLAIIGVFTYAFILLPASIGFSIVGFVKRTNTRTLGLSIAGIVVGIVAILIMVGTWLDRLGVIPDWLRAGIFG